MKIKIKILEKVIKRMVKKIKLKDILVNVGDAYVKATKSETDDKVWKQIKDMIKGM
jgi:hypothetical protein